MNTDIKTILSRYSINWRDHGKNVSRGNIVISCPFCNKTTNQDRGEHLSINTSTLEFFCYRNQTHKGRGVKLFKLLNIPSKEYAGMEFKEVERDVRTDTRDYSYFQFFDNADSDMEAVEYLRGRKFTDPWGTCKRFNLKVSKEGKWAGRLIIPLTVGWTGRAMRSHIELRYLTHGSEESFFFFKQGSKSCIVLEGAIDAMRVVTVSSQFDVVAKCQGGVSPALLSHLRNFGYMSVYNVPDGTVPWLQANEETRTLRSYCPEAVVKKLAFPQEPKDFGAMEEDLARGWLYANAK